MAIDLIQSLISTYFSIVRQTIQDLVPKVSRCGGPRPKTSMAWDSVDRACAKGFICPFASNPVSSVLLCVATRLTAAIFLLLSQAVMHLLIGHSRESVQNRLVASLYKENLFEDLLYEDEGLTSERARIKALLDSYKEGFRVSLTSMRTRVFEAAYVYDISS